MIDMNKEAMIEMNRKEYETHILKLLLRNQYDQYKEK